MASASSSTPPLRSPRAQASMAASLPSAAPSSTAPATAAAAAEAAKLGLVFRAPAPPVTLAPEQPPPDPFKGFIRVRGPASSVSATDHATTGSWGPTGNSDDVYLRTLIVLDGVYLRRVSFAVDFQSLIDQIHARMGGVSYHRVLCSAQPIEDEAVVELCLHPPEGPGLEVNMNAWKRGLQPGDAVKATDRAGVDAAIATTILLHAWTDQCDRIVVVSGDGYFVEALKICRDLVGKLVVVAGTYTSLSPVLQMAATDVLYLDGVLNSVGEFGTAVAMPRTLKAIGRPHTVQFGALTDLGHGRSRAPGADDDPAEDAAVNALDAEVEALALQSRAHAKARRERERLQPRPASATIAVDPTPDDQVPTADISSQNPIQVVRRQDSDPDRVAVAPPGATLSAAAPTTKKRAGTAKKRSTLPAAGSQPTSTSSGS